MLTQQQQYRMTKRHLLKLFGSCLVPRAVAQTRSPLRIIGFGAHPDDCEIKAAGVAALWSKLGHAVKFVATTNGDAGHPVEGGAPLARRRHAESANVAKILGIEYDIMNVHDGELMPSLENRLEIIRRIRDWQADLVLSPRPNDYHPDHRYTGVLVQDAAYLVAVPAVLPNVPIVRRNPTFLFYEDRFQKPTPFHPDIVVDISSVWDKKIDALDANESQFYEFQTNVNASVSVPAGKSERKKWLAERRKPGATPEIEKAYAQWYGATRMPAYFEAFEICEYGSQPDAARIRELFPMLPRS
jgi:LmbE family N-acetylglucosaminyl deacetylase